MSKRYEIIYADPPWDFGGAKLNAVTSGKEISDHYPTMPDEDILYLDVESITAKDCLLFMWVVHSKLPLAINCIKQWGFEYSTVAFEWLKRTSTGLPVCFMGKWTCGGAIELCLLGRKGSIPRIAKDVRRLIDTPRRKHSQKPDETRDRIVDLVGNAPRIELFSRNKIAGWDTWGNELDSDVKLEVIMPEERQRRNEEAVKQAAASIVEQGQSLNLNDFDDLIL